MDPVGTLGGKLKNFPRGAGAPRASLFYRNLTFLAAFGVRDRCTHKQPLGPGPWDILADPVDHPWGSCRVPQ